MDIKKIIREEVDDFEWVKNVPMSKPIQIGGYKYYDGSGKHVPFDTITLGDTVRYPIMNTSSTVSFKVEKIMYDGKIYNSENIYTIPDGVSNHNSSWAVNLWGSGQPNPYYGENNEINWCDGGKAYKV